MSVPKRMNDSVHWFMNDLSSRIIAQTGIPNDRFHLGKLIFQSLKDDPEFLLQIDGSTGESETNGSVLKRSIQCAIALTNLGLKREDIIVIMAPNHIHLTIPFYASLYIGVGTSAVDRTLGPIELKECFEVSRPKVIFCQNEKVTDVQLALDKLDHNAHIITFDNGDYLLNYEEFLRKYGDDTSVDHFRPSDFDPEKTTALLIATSGTTGLPKSATVTHKNIAITNPYLWIKESQFPSPTRMVLICSPMQWMTAIINFVLSPIIRYTRLQSTESITPEHAAYIIDKYKPTFTIMSPTLMTTLLKNGLAKNCDMSCFELIYLAGSAVSRELLEDVKQVMPHTEVRNIFGMTELSSIAFMQDNGPIESCGKPLGCFQYRLVSLETKKDIIEPNISGELWVNGPGIFKEYYNNPQATLETFAEDRWFKTGDMFYRDEHYNYYYVERIKLLLKYRNHQISPLELETVIRQHPAVQDVAVAGIPDAECGDLPVACVVIRTGHTVTAQEIKDLVKDNLTDTKQLRGGVIFLNEIPMTANTKIHRRKLKELVLTMDKE
ncbi:PREDICTED: luciferin 4-monooxygenase-like isoform X2 [Papilio xuthus]|uniref:Luciferin 4-monooxygenase n=1 Tax=Papilio xuthus TaxID=66420 RepID=A0A194PZY0_PAPXU|nr:PREDICTED: luciferin 4-monooxygenase-like isoform X2 [Papilio xuthus]KPI98876.1 Luciferin 4-monooxygenase [Papilio xuthus]